MPRRIGGQRQARSFVTPAGAEVVTRTIDFNFASDQGIEIIAVLGNLHGDDTSPAVSDTVPARIQAAQSLHLEEGTPEDVPIASAEDADEVDTEVFFHQDIAGQFQVPATAGGGGGNSPSQSLYIPYRDPIFVARNITHRGEGVATGQAVFAHVLIFYYFVRFTDSEIVGILARRT